MAKRSVVVTGGTGALGRAVVNRLLEQDARCHATWEFAEELEGFEARERVELHELDCADEAAVTSFYSRLPGIDASIPTSLADSRWRRSPKRGSRISGGCSTCTS
jgi:NAD(P)-dependent dehydrogenase (short-subunit alcohol dehydrogenase family)